MSNQKDAAHAVSATVSKECHRRSGLIGLATIRRDGFIAMRAGDRKGRLITRPLSFNGGRLLLNALTRQGGYVKAELVDPTGRALPGYTCEECIAFTGDAVESELRWACGARMPKSDPCGTRIRLVLKNGDLLALGLAEADDRPTATR